MASAELMLLYQALQSPLGIEVKTTDPRLAKQRLYKERSVHADLQDLQLRTSPHDPSAIWITKRKPEEEPPE